MPELRAQSVAGQLNGSVPSTTEAQKGSTVLIETGDLNLLALGSLNMGGKGGDGAMGDRRPGKNKSE